MKLKLYSILLTLAVVAGLSSCDNGLDPNGPTAIGQLKLSSLALDVDEAENEISRSGISTDEFRVVVKNSDGKTAGEWTYAEMPEIITLPVGSYKVNIESHELQSAEWDKPYFAGSKEFRIKDGQITEIGNVVCSFQSLKVSVQYTAALKKAMAEDCKVTVVANDNGRLEYGRDETRVGCFAVIEGSHTLVASFSGTVNGYFTQLSKEFKDVEKGQHYKLTFRIKGVDPGMPDETGQVDPSQGVTVDLSVVDQDITGNLDDDEDIINNPTRPGQDDPEKPNVPDDPNIPDDPNDNYTLTITSETINLDGTNVPEEGKEYVVMINSSEGVAHLEVNISTDNENFESAAGQMVPLNFDLAYPENTPGDYNGNTATEALALLGFPIQDKVIGAHEVRFDITGFVPLLGAFDGTHNFKMTVTDVKGHKESKTLIFVVE